METKPRATAVPRVYEDFKPISDWVQEEGSNSFLMHLPGFTREQLKVQIYDSNSLKIYGERPLENNKWIRFSMDIRVPPDCNPKAIRANLENGILYLKMQKITAKADPKDEPKPTPKAPTFEKTPSLPPSEKALDHAPQKAISFASAENQMNGKGSEQANAKNVAQMAPEKDKQPSETNGKGSEQADAKDVAQKAPEKKEMSDGPAVAGSVTNGVSEKQEKVNESTDNAKIKDGGTENVTGGDRYKMKASKEFVGGLFMNLKKPRKVTVYKVVAVTVVVALGVYLTYKLVVPEKAQN